MKRKTFFLTGCGLLCVLAAAAQRTVTDTVRLTLGIDSVALHEVVVRGRRTLAANSRWSDMHPVELATVGGANGDLYKALQTLPGTQLQGETGELLVRGGSSRETQTFIDGMHVLNPYTSNGINTPARSRYSTFLFSGVNLASGGASQEYGEALSAVLPLETKDESRVNKMGVNPSLIGVGGGGTRAFDNGSLSVDLNCQDLRLYDRMYSGRREFAKPYRMRSGAAQFRYTPGRATVLKVYAQYDRTDFSAYEGDARRLFALGENNAYVNATLRRHTSRGWDCFAGASYSRYDRRIDGAATPGDRWTERQQELHLKLKAARHLPSAFRLDMGLESYLRRYRQAYLLAEARHLRRLQPAVCAAFFSTSYYLAERWKAELSVRAEYTFPNRKANLSPRLALNYYGRNVMLSATAGRYTQLPEDSLLVRRRDLPSEVCTQYNLGVQYNVGGRFCKAELYCKDYDRLALYEAAAGTHALLLTSHGYGYSKGLDLFFSDRASFRRLEYRLSYTYNLAKRKYRQYSELSVPQYATRHNAALVVKYSLPRLRSILSVTDRFSSGRPYHNSALPGLMNDEVKPYNSLDVGLTVLASRKVIIHASATNILSRANEFGRVGSRPVLASADHFFYLGVYVTLGKKAAYDVSNF